MMAVAMLSHRGQAVDNSTRGGMDNTRHCHWYGDNDNDGWDLSLPHTARAKATDVAMPQSPSTDDSIDYDNKGGG
jgi:hypothetical protein